MNKSNHPLKFKVLKANRMLTFILSMLIISKNKKKLSRLMNELSQVIKNNKKKEVMLRKAQNQLTR
jgi:hypothetical protein